MTIKQALDNFIYSRRLKGLSEKSVLCYFSFNKRFIDYVGPDKDIYTINSDLVNTYIYGLFNNALSRSTIATYIRHLKIFLKWLEKEYEICFESYKIKVPKTPKKVLHIYTDSELSQIFKTIETSVPWITARNCCIVALMLDSGLRQNEICTLQRCDISFDTGTLKICGKGNKERIVPFGLFSRHYLAEYKKLCPFNDKYFFLSKNGEHLSTNAVKLFMQKTSSNLPFEFSSHKLRHNFATHYCIDQYHQYGQVDIYKLMILMGHEEITTTRRYLHFANQIIIAESNISHLDLVFDLKN